MGSIPGSGKFAGGGHGNPLQYSCLENSMDRGAWQAMVHRITKSLTTEASKHTHIHTAITYYTLCQHKKSMILGFLSLVSISKQNLSPLHSVAWTSSLELYWWFPLFQSLFGFILILSITISDFPFPKNKRKIPSLCMHNHTHIFYLSFQSPTMCKIYCFTLCSESSCIIKCPQINSCLCIKIFMSIL